MAWSGTVSGNRELRRSAAAIVKAPGMRVRISKELRRGEVPDRHDVIPWAEPSHEPHQIEPQVAPSILVMEAVAQVEAIDVGNDAGYDAL